MEFLYLAVLLHVYYAAAEIRTSVIVNKLAKVRPVGAHVGKTFIPLTELPPPLLSGLDLSDQETNILEKSGRRHFDDCNKKSHGKEVFEGPQVDIFAEYYDDKVGKTVATVVFPDHIDHKHFEVTTSVPYLTLGPIQAIGYHPSTIKSDHPSECEKIYQEHVNAQYSDESRDYSEESLEMARMPLMPSVVPASIEDRLEKMYSDLES